jgi:hypothetical protein
MGLFTGRASFTRFRVSESPKMFTDEQVAKLAEHAAGRQRMVASDGIEFGWSAGGNILDTNFTLEKNIVNDYLRFCMRVDSLALPADLMKAYYDIDLAAISSNNPSGFASKLQKREAKESARDRLEQEAKDGRYTKRKAIEVAWDLRRGEVLFGSTSASQLFRLHQLFSKTFAASLQPMWAGDSMDYLDDMPTLSSFVNGVSPDDVVWSPDEMVPNFLGNEFLMWLWYQCNEESAEIKLPDGTSAVVMFSDSLSLDCPRGMTGKEQFTHEMPIRLPEAMAAIRSGKLPRKAGLTVVRHGVQASFTLFAEKMAVGAAKMPAPEAESERTRLEARADQLRDFIEMLDLLYGAFCQVRLGDQWADELQRMQRWLSYEPVMV